MKKQNHKEDALIEKFTCIYIESHFELPGHEIKAETRNVCSLSLVSCIREIGFILFPNEKFEVYLLPPEKGSYKDIIKIAKSPATTFAATCILTLTQLVYSHLTYADSHEEHSHNVTLRSVDETAKCLSLKEQIESLQKTYKIENIDYQKIDEICGNIRLKKIKNEKFEALMKDDMISSEETIIKDANNEIFLYKKISQQDFNKYIEPIDDQDYAVQNISGIIELISLVIKQKKEGKGIPWKGIYYGQDIRYKGVNILTNGEEINFYMQDEDFKNKINEHQITFGSGDNMTVVLDLKAIIKSDTSLSRSIYVSYVAQFNEIQIPHKIKSQKKDNSVVEGQDYLFDSAVQAITPTKLLDKPN